jgi:hypothetical protein
MLFQKGKSGNPEGRRREKYEKLFAEALRMELKASGDDHKALRRIARNLIAQACVEDPSALSAIREIADRLDGKPAQESTLTLARVAAQELTDDALAAIAVGEDESDNNIEPDPSLKLN